MIRQIDIRPKDKNDYFDGCSLIKNISIEESLKTFAKTKAYYNNPDRNVKKRKIQND